MNTSDSRDSHQAPRDETSSEPTPVPSALLQAANASNGGKILQIGGDNKPTIIKGRRWVLYEPIPREDVASLVETFVEPPRYQEAHQILWGGDSVESVVVICDDIGIGRRSAAIHLLSNGGTFPVHEIQPDWESPRADVLPTTEEHNFLLDLTDTEQVVSERFGKSLRSLALELRKNDARLVITVTPDKWRACRSNTPALIAPLGIPEQSMVLKKHLHHDRGKLPEAAIEAPPPASLSSIVKTLSANEEPPRRVVDLAKAIRKHAVLNEKTVAEIGEEFRHWEGYLNEQFSRRESTADSSYVVAWRRVLLISAAVFDGAPSEVVFQAAHKLLISTVVKPESHELITGPELSELLSDIQGHNKGGHITITDRHPDLDIAVLDRVWEQRPGLQKIILTWITSVTAENGVAAEQQDRAADILSKFAVSQRTTRVLEVIQPWIAGPARQHKLAVKMLEQLATSPDIGAAIRHRLYRWATSKQDDNVDLHRAVAAVCGGRLGETHLAVALVRLRHLAVSKNSIVQEATAEAVRTLASSQDRAMQILQQAIEWANDSKDSSLQTAGSFILMELLRPNDQGSAVASILVAAKENSRFRSQLQDTWSSLLESPSTREAAVVLSKTWQDSADKQLLDQDAVINVLAPGLRDHGHKEGVARAFMNGNSPTSRRLVAHFMSLPNSQEMKHQENFPASASEGAK